jgi:AcrR family transcriptional regulator
MSSLKAKTAVVRDRRQHILEQAERLFADHGYEGAALAEIARAAGLGNAGLIHHFPSKAALYRAVLEQLGTDLDARLSAAIAGEADPGARLRAFIMVQVDWALERPMGVRVIQREILDNVDRMPKARALPLARFANTGKTIIEEAQAAGVVAPGPPEVVLNYVIGTLTYAAVVRPTLQKILGTRLVRTDAAWLRANATAILDTLLRHP